MKKWMTSDGGMMVGATQQDGKYIIIIEKERKMLVATKGSRKPHIEYDYSHFEKAFDTPEQANRYFLGIKKNHPTLRMV